MSDEADDMAFAAQERADEILFRYGRHHMPDTLPYAKDAKPELDKPGPRKALNRAQIITLAIRQINAAGVLVCGCGCGVPLDPVCIDEHLTPRETLPADRCDDLDNRALFNRECSKAKTVKDQAVIGHWRRVRQDSGQKKRLKENGSKLQSRNTLSPSSPKAGAGRLQSEYVSPLSKKHPNYRKRGFGK